MLLPYLARAPKSDADILVTRTIDRPTERTTTRFLPRSLFDGCGHGEREGREEGIIEAVGRPDAQQKEAKLKMRLTASLVVYSSVGLAVIQGSVESIVFA